MVRCCPLGALTQQTRIKAHAFARHHLNVSKLRALMATNDAEPASATAASVEDTMSAGPTLVQGSAVSDGTELGRAQDRSLIRVGDVVLVQCEDDPPYPSVVVSGAPAKVRIGTSSYRTPLYGLGVVWLGLGHCQPPCVAACPRELSKQG